MAITKNAVKVRRFTKDDIPTIIEICMREIPKLPHYASVTVKEDRLKFLLSNAVNDESTFMFNVLVNDEGKIVGGSGAYCVTMLISDDKMCNDMFLWVDPEWRSFQSVVKLINAYKEWGKRRRAKIICATQTSGIRSDAMEMLLMRNGFERVGAMYYITL